MITSVLSILVKHSEYPFVWLYEDFMTYFPYMASAESRYPLKNKWKKENMFTFIYVMS